MNRDAQLLEKKNSERLLGLRGKYGRYEVNRAYKKLIRKAGGEPTGKHGYCTDEARAIMKARDCLLRFVEEHHIVECEKGFFIPRGPSYFR